jgi:RNA polymerase sigma-70 factor (ECF subfamily)
MIPPGSSLYADMGPPPPPFAPLYRAHFRLVRHLVALVGVRDADVADVVQEVFARLDRALRGGLDASRPLLGWLKRTAVRCACDHRALARSREQPATEAMDPADGGPNPEEHMEIIEARSHVRAVLDALPDELRLVLVMSDVEEMPMTEIAEVLEIPVGTGYTRLRAARGRFEQTWAQRRAGGLAGVAPFLLWDAQSLLKTQQAVPPAPDGFEEEVWRRLTETMGRGLAGGAAAAGAVKAGMVLSAKQLAAGALVAALVGAGIHAVVGAAREVPPVAAVGVPADRDGVAAGVPGAAVSSTASAEAAPTAPEGTAAPTATAPTAAAPTAAEGTAAPTAAPNHEAAERMLLDSARAAIEQGHLAEARAALSRVKSPRFAAQRDELRRLVNAYQDGGR